MPLGDRNPVTTKLICRLINQEPVPYDPISLSAHRDGIKHGNCMGIAAAASAAAMSLIINKI